jgi:predicted MarR family transcription regulator
VTAVVVLPVAAGGDGSASELADCVHHMIRHHSSRWVDVPGRRIDHDRHGAAPNADPAIDQQRQRVFNATLAVEQLGARKVSIEVTHGRRPVGCYADIRSRVATSRLSRALRQCSTVRTA